MSREKLNVYDAWESYTLMIKHCPSHKLDDFVLVQHFTKGLRGEIKLLLDALTNQMGEP